MKRRLVSYRLWSLVGCILLALTCCRVVADTTENVVVDNNNDKRSSEAAVGAEAAKDDLETSEKQPNSKKDASTKLLPDDYYRLDENSVVLLTGAAGFLGSELAIALRRVYNVKKLVLIDHMSITPPSTLGGASSSSSSSSAQDSSSSTTATTPAKSLQELHRLEYHRQRVFRVLQAIGDAASFYRVDVRANVPEYYQAGEVPLLRHILSQHKDITHVVHLASERSTTSSITRVEPEAKAGLIETLLEELRALQKTSDDSKPLPHFLYASSADVYDPYPSENNGTTTGAPFDESSPIDTPANFAGAAKLMDEILAQAYHDMDGLASIGLRFFDVYGPWGNPASLLHRLTEQAVLEPSKPFHLEETMNSVHDYIYVDDAVDAIMTAMQIQTSQPLIVNVGTGIPTAWNQVVDIMQRHEPALRVVESVESGATHARQQSTATTVSYASTKRATALLGLNPQVPFEQGLERLVAWHRDRAFPYGGSEKKRAVQTTGDGTATSVSALYGVASCAKGDVDCLLGAPVFYCAASDCANSDHCWGSFWDDVVSWTRLYTSETPGCSEAVMYTVALDDQLTTLLPGGDTKMHARNSKSYLKGRCNLAFVSDTSPLVRRLLQDPSSTVKTSNVDLGILITHGPWTVVPVSVTRGPAASSSSKTSALPRALEYLPKWSPSSFFTSKVAVYVDPHVVLEDLQSVLKEFENAPPSVPGYDNGGKASALMVGRVDPHRASSLRSDNRRRVLRSSLSGVQEAAYRMIRIAAIDDMRSDGFVIPLDTSSVLVHRNAGEDPRLFRCDVLQELVQWEVADAEHEAMSLQFVSSLHDLWSRLLAKKQEGQVWWNLPNMQAKDPVRADPKPAPQDESKAAEKGEPDQTNVKELPVQSKRKADADASKDENDEEGTADEGDAKDDVRAQETDGLDEEEEVGLDGRADSNAFVDAVGSESEHLEGEIGKTVGGDASPEAPGDDEDEDEAESGTVVRVPDTALQAAAAVVADARNQEDDGTKTESELGAVPDAAEKEGGSSDADVKASRRRLLAVQSDSEHGQGQDPFAGMPEAIQDAVRAVFGDAALHRRGADYADNRDASVQSYGTSKDEASKADSQRSPSDGEKDGDVWMGVLSSSHVQYFCRIVPQEALGLVDAVDRSDGLPQLSTLS